MKRKITAILIAWLLFIGVDFLFHASLLTSLWKEDIVALKSLENLSVLIPVGYLSFLLLTILIGYLFFRIFRSKPSVNQVLQFGFFFGILFSLSNLLGLYSFVEIPLKHLVLFNLVYFIEIIVVTLSLYFTLYSAKRRKVIWISVLVFFLLIFLGILIQNIFQNIG